VFPLWSCLLCVAALLVAEARGARIWIAVAKLGAAASFVAAALSWGALSSDYGQVMLAGLLLCALGDALLLPPGRGVSFQLGIGAFLLGHVAYGWAFLGLPSQGGALVAAAAALLVFAVVVLRWLRPHVPADFRFSVGAYVIVISAMVVTAVGAVAGGAPWVVAIGAIGFALSDLSVARARFISPGFVNAVWGLPLYFGSQLLLAWSVASFS
jgi:uncharacterized membrane protein YhhN